MPKDTTTTKKNSKKTQKPSEKARKAKKDPKDKEKATKRPLSAYLFFSQDWRERIKTENPDAGFGEIGKLLGAKWKELDDEEKKPYINQAALDKKRVDDLKNEKVEAQEGDGEGGQQEGDEEAGDEE